MYRGAYCARIGPLPLLPSGPGGVGGLASRRSRHTDDDTTRDGVKNPREDPFEKQERVILNGAERNEESREFLPQSFSHYPLDSSLRSE